MREKSCFFTGHRKLPSARLERLRRLLEEKIEQLIQEGVTDFICGGALGFDLFAGETVVALQKKYPEIRLLLYLPCYASDKSWPDQERWRLKMLQFHSDVCEYITPGSYDSQCMKRRNYKMADDATYGLAYCTLERSGTGQTLRYARQRGCIVKNLADLIYQELE